MEKVTCCTKCGMMNPEDAVFCQKCGSRLQSAQNILQPQFAPNASTLVEERDMMEEKIPVVFRPLRNKKCNYYQDCPTCDYKDLCEPYNNARGIEDFCNSLRKMTGKPDEEKYV